MLIFLIAGSVALLIHECGHALAQFLFKIPVKELVWGFGPRLFKFGVFEVRLIPFKGYVHPAGPLYAKKRWHGISIALAGVVMTWIGVLVLFITQAVKVPWLKDFSVWYTLWAFLSLLELLPFGRRDGAWIKYMILNNPAKRGQVK